MRNLLLLLAASLLPLGCDDGGPLPSCPLMDLATATQDLAETQAMEDHMIHPPDLDSTTEDLVRPDVDLAQEFDLAEPWPDLVEPPDLTDMTYTGDLGPRDYLVADSISPDLTPPCVMDVQRRPLNSPPVVCCPGWFDTTDPGTRGCQQKFGLGGPCQSNDWCVSGLCSAQKGRVCVQPPSQPCKFDANCQFLCVGGVCSTCDRNCVKGSPCNEDANCANNLCVQNKCS